MIGDEGDVHGFRIDRVDAVQIALRIPGEDIHVSLQGGLRDQAVHHRRGEVETVEGCQVTVDNRVAVPDFGDRVDIRIDLLQLFHVPEPEVLILAVFSVVRVLGRVETEAVDADAEPVRGDVQHGFPYFFVIEIQFGHGIRKVALIQDVRTLQA